MSDSTPDELGSELLAVVARLNRWATSQAELPVLYGQARLLSLIDLHGPARISELAAADHCSQPSMTQQLGKLDESGWIQRTADPADARAVLISLTPTGVAALLRTRAARSAVVAPHLAAMSPTGRRQIGAAVTALRSLMDRLTEHAPDTPPRPAAPSTRAAQSTAAAQKDHS